MFLAFLMLQLPSKNILIEKFNIFVIVYWDNILINTKDLG